MAIIVVVLMFGFIGGTALQTLLQRGRFGRAKAVAYCLGGQKITAADILRARREMEILKMLRTDVLLRSIRDQQTGQVDLHAFLLGEVLFGERSTAPAVMGALKQLITSQGYRISLRQISDMYDRRVTNDIYWLLLKREARQAGVTVPNEDAGRYLSVVIPKVVENGSYSSIVSNIVNRQGIPEKEVLGTFAKLLAVLEYGRMVCSTEALTTQQLRHSISYKRETMNVDYIKFDSSLFADEQPEPTQEQIEQHFNKYKSYFAGSVSESNPYGFGYKLDERVRLEYIAIKLDDVEKIIEQPTLEEAENYYAANAERFAIQVPSDANDPNSKPVERIRSFAEVANTIYDILLQNKKDAKATEILEAASKLTGASRDDLEPASGGGDAEGSGADYTSAAKKLSEEYGIKVYSGQTGLLSADDIYRDEYLGRLYTSGFGQSLVGINQLVFAVEGLETADLGPAGLERPHLYENLGPFKDMFGRVMVLLRVIEAKKAAEPNSVEVSFDNEGMVLEQDHNPQEQAKPENKKTFSVRQRVVEDLRKLRAMETTHKRAVEFKLLVAQLGWEEALKQFNERYGGSDSNSDDPNAASASSRQQQPFELETEQDIRRISGEQLLALEVQSQGNPRGRIIVDDIKRRAMFREQLYRLVPSDANNLESVPFIMEFKPGLCYYCLKRLSVERVSRDQYEQSKPIQAYYSDLIQSQSLAVVHLNPENILRRTGFIWVKKEESKSGADANSTSGPEGS